MLTKISQPALVLTEADPYLSLDDACGQFPGRPHRATVWRWALKGVSRHGANIRLRTIICGSRRFTQREWCVEFLSALNADNPSSSADDALRRAREAGRALEALGC